MEHVRRVAPARLVWRALAVLTGLLLGAVWFVGSGLALGLAECAPQTLSALCDPRREHLLAALEAAIILAGTIIAPLCGVLAARRGRPEWLIGAVALLGALSLCADLVLADQAQPPG